MRQGECGMKQGSAASCRQSEFGRIFHPRPRPGSPIPIQLGTARTSNLHRQIDMI
jgi:hypothetical protein